MTPNEYQQLCMRTSGTAHMEDPEQIRQALVMNGALGLGGETGEVLDLVKKATFQGHSLSTDRVAEELGDICWYIATLARGIGYDFEDILTKNIAKLQRRYPSGFSTEASVNRTDEH